MSDEQTQDVVEAQEEAYDGPSQSVEEVAAGLAAALRSGNAQASEAALANYDALALDEDGFDLGLGPLKRNLSPQEAADNSEVGGGTDDDIEAAAINAGDGDAFTTIGTHDSAFVEASQDVSDESPAERAEAEDEVQTSDGEPGYDPDDESDGQAADAPFNPTV